MEIIAGGMVVDGTGAPRRCADIAIEGDSIVAVGDLSRLEGIRQDARGLFVAPGFIDLHTHTDLTVLGNRDMRSSIRQGVTTEVCGNCGLQVGLALDRPEFAPELRMLDGEEPATWTSLADFMARVEAGGVAANLAFLVGHGTLRKRVMGWDAGAPDGEALRRMRALVRQSLEEGAYGLSTGLEYAPGSCATEAELVELVREVAAVDGLYATHLRDEAGGLLESVAEALRIGRQSGASVQLSHHKAEGRRNWGKVEHSLALLEETRAGGVDAACDVYPYTAFMTGLGVRTLPAWAQQGSMEQIVARLREPVSRARILAEMDGLDLDWAQLQIAGARRDRSLQGRTIGEIAREHGLTPQEAVLEVLASQHGMVSSISFEMAEEDMRRVLGYPGACVIADSAARDAVGLSARDRPHPRGFGTFPRTLGHYVREAGLLSWEEAIHKMTGLPASRLGLKRRGVLAPGNRADIVLFDPATVQDQATYAAPDRFPLGIRAVYVNGVAVVREGVETGARPGRVLRRGAPE